MEEETKTAEVMSRSEIVDLLNDWFDNKVIISTNNTKSLDSHVELLSKTRKITYTPISKLLFNGDGFGDSNYELLLNLINTQRIMTNLSARANKRYVTFYQLKKGVSKNELARFCRDGLILYID